MRSQILLPVVIAGFVGAAAVVACSTSSTPAATVTFTVSPGVPTYTYTGSLGSCSTEDTYVVIAVGDCGGCSGSTAYALCDGTSYTDCSCDAPVGSGWVEGSSASDSGSDTGNGGDTGTDSSSVGDGSTDASSGDSSSDAGSSDAGSSDAGSADSGSADAGTGGG